MRIKPCPFCGKQPSVFRYNGGEMRIECVDPDCQASVRIEATNEQRAVNKWNTRAYEKEISALESRLKHLLQSDTVRLYDEFDPTISGGYTRDISELDHLVFDSKREEKEEKTAHWDINCDGYYPFCSHCGEATQHMSRFCPNCGAKMITRGHEDA